MISALIFICSLVNFVCGYSDVITTTSFNNWMMENNRVYSSFDEYIYRFKVFANNYRFINDHNSDPYTTYSLAMNKFGDLTPDEFQSIYVNDFPINTDYCDMYAFKGANVSNTIDWRQRDGVVSEVKDQGQCGSCWAFSTVEVFESFVAVKSNSSVMNLSPQELVDCSQSYGNNGCQGGMMDGSFRYIIDKKGLCSQDEINYTAQDGNCQQEMTGCTKRYGGEFITNCYNIVSGEQLSMKEAVNNYPISIAIEADTNIFQFYSEGVITGDDCGQNLDHAVAVVGYNTENGIDYWIVRNSWGSNWGDNGYVYIQRDNSNNSTGVCGIAIASVFPY